MKRNIAIPFVVVILFLLGFAVAAELYTHPHSRRIFASFEAGIPADGISATHTLTQRFTLPGHTPRFNRFYLWLENPRGKKTRCRFHLYEADTGKTILRKPFILNNVPSGWHVERFTFPATGGEGEGRYIFEVAGEKDSLGFTVLTARVGAGELQAGNSTYHGFLPFELYSTARLSWLDRLLAGREGGGSGFYLLLAGAAAALCFALAGLFLLKMFYIVPGDTGALILDERRGHPEAPGTEGVTLTRAHYLFLIFAAFFLWAVISVSFMWDSNTYARLLGAEDDAFITYRYAQNIVEGRGFRFNDDERTLGTTTPLYTLALAGAGLVFRDIPLSSLALNWLAVFLGGVILSRALSRFIFPGTAALGGAVFMFFPMFHRISGMETNFLIFLLMLAIYLFSRGRSVLAFFIAGLAALTRSEALLLAPLFLLVLLLRREVKTMLKGAGVFMLTLLPWCVFSFFYFDALLPNTFFIKTSGGHLGGSLWRRLAGKLEGVFSLRFLDSAFIVAFVRELPYYFHYYFTWMVLFAAGLFLSAREMIRREFLRLLVLWILLYVLGFAVLDTPPFAWYYVLAFALIPAVLACGLERVRVLGAALMKNKRAGFSAAAILGLLLLGFETAGVLELFYGDWYARHMPRLERYDTYLHISSFIRARVPARESVAMEEIGIVGYYTENKIWDFYSLVHRAGRLPFGFPAESKQRIPYLLTLMDPGYVLVSSHRYLTHYAFRDYEMVGIFPVLQVRWDPEFYYMLLKKRVGQMPVLGEFNVGGDIAGRVRLMGWVMGSRRIDYVQAVLDGKPLRDRFFLEKSPRDLAELFSFNAASGEALFFWELDSALLANGVHHIKLNAVSGGFTGTFWEGEIRVVNAIPQMKP